MEVNEFNVPAPWGDIAVKAWGSKTNEAVITSHGFMDNAVKTWGDIRNEAILLSHGKFDNAGTYDQLIPQLPKNFYYICFDFPGHGLSSHFPIGTPIIDIDYILVYKIVADFFENKSYILIGHSIGGQTAITFTQMYPEYVRKLIILDAVSYRKITSSMFFDTLEKAINTALQPKKSKSIFTKQQVLKLLMENRLFGVLTKQAAECLMARTFEKVGDDAYVSRSDSRVKDMLIPSSDDDSYFLEIHKKYPIKCKVLVILLETAEFYKTFPEIFQHFKDRKFEIHLLKGHHDYHNTNPEAIAPIVSEFLTRSNKL